nr:helix-turn-helix transcriptional regulator [Nocardioides yefusunii]
MVRPGSRSLRDGGEGRALHVAKGLHRLMFMNPSALMAELLAVGGLSKAELSRRSGVSRTAIDAYLSGTKAPTTRQLNKLAAAAGCQVDAQITTMAHRVSENPERRERLIAVLELGETFPAKTFKPLPDLSDVWAAARERAGSAA